MQLSSDSRKYRKNVTIESVIIRPLPSEFINYLKSDGVRLPDCATKVSSSMNDVDADDEWAAEDSGDECDSFSFQTLTDEIQLAINSFGGEGKKGCMPKLNWSSPKDATWINCGSLKCTKVGDVYLLLKSSEFITFDLENAWIDVDNDVDESIELNPILDDEQKFELVLRKWCNLHPSMEFRCFVYEHELSKYCNSTIHKYFSSFHANIHSQLHSCCISASPKQILYTPPTFWRRRKPNPDDNTEVLSHICSEKNCRG